MIAEAPAVVDPSWREIEAHLRREIAYWRGCALWERNDAGVRSVVAGLVIALTIVTGKSYADLSAEVAAPEVRL